MRIKSAESTESEYSTWIITFLVIWHKKLPNNLQTVLESPNLNPNSSSKSCDMESNALEKSNWTDIENPDLSTPRWISSIILVKAVAVLKVFETQTDRAKSSCQRQGNPQTDHISTSQTL
jgi:hypothetical protein